MKKFVLIFLCLVLFACRSKEEQAKKDAINKRYDAIEDSLNQQILYLNQTIDTIGYQIELTQNKTFLEDSLKKTFQLLMSTERQKKYLLYERKRVE